MKTRVHNITLFRISVFIRNTVNVETVLINLHIPPYYELQSGVIDAKRLCQIDLKKTHQ